MIDNRLTMEKLRKLAAYEAPLCLTMMIPCHKSGDRQQQNVIRFKNTLQEAMAKLEKVDCDKQQIKRFLSPFGRLLEERDFWKNQDQGLIVFIAEGVYEYYSLPFNVDVNVIVDRHFYLRSVIPYMRRTAEFAVLLLEINGSVLITRSEQTGKYEVHTAPGRFYAFEKFMEIYDTGKSLQFHGQAGEESAQKTHLTEYFKQLESWVKEQALKCDFQHVFVVAQPHIEGLYKQVLREDHPELHILAQKNPASGKPEFWAEQADKMLKQEFEKERDEIVSMYKQLKETQAGKVEDSIPGIVQAAHSRRIETLILPGNSHDYYWGRFDPGTNRVHRQRKDENLTGPGDELINLAVIKTFLNGGKVMTMPDGTYPNYAALCRW